jgi:two-component system, chemotaxis family, protein-glutamate methylesterase/glutaminase
MANLGRDIVVVGTSAGGLEALETLVRHLPADFNASLFIVQHIPPQGSAEALLSRLQKKTALRCKLADDQERFLPRTIYVARPDFHLLLKKAHTLLVTKGARENRYRPAIDPLFRSAAVAYGSRVIGVVLTGMLDDGTVGLLAIKQCGGLTVIQDPQDAAFPQMPQSAQRNVEIDHSVSIEAMGPLLGKLIRERRGKSRPVPPEVRIEALIAERVLSDVSQVNNLGEQVPYNCPNCAGVLWEMAASKSRRYRCHTGHSFTSSTLITSQSEKIEETLWISLRMFEERKNLLNSMAEKEFGTARKRRYSQQAKDTEIHIERIRAMLLSSAGESLSRKISRKKWTSRVIER